MSSDDQEVPELVRRLRARRDRYQRRGTVYKVAFVAIGVTVTVAGLAMVIFPGPAFLVIPIGLAMLALQFAWAERLLEKAIQRGEVAKRKAASAGGAQKLLGALAVVLGVGAAVAAAIYWDIPLLPV